MKVFENRLDMAKSAWVKNVMKIYNISEEQAYELLLKIQPYGKAGEKLPKVTSLNKK